MSKTQFFPLIIVKMKKLVLVFLKNEVKCMLCQRNLQDAES